MWPNVPFLTMFSCACFPIIPPLIRPQRPAHWHTLVYSSHSLRERLVATCYCFRLSKYMTFVLTLETWLSVPTVPEPWREILQRQYGGPGQCGQSRLRGQGQGLQAAMERTLRQRQGILLPPSAILLLILSLKEDYFIPVLHTDIGNTKQHRNFRAVNLK